jgi:signal transduction histidine kinase
LVKPYAVKISGQCLGQWTELDSFREPLFNEISTVDPLAPNPALESLAERAQFRGVFGKSGGKATRRWNFHKTDSDGLLTGQRLHGDPLQRFGDCDLAGCFPVRMRSGSQNLIVRQMAIPPYGFLWALWVVRGLGSLVIALVVAAFYFRSRTAALALKYERENAENLERIARQVGHDVRSPIGALKIILAKYLKAESPEFELSANALGRIEQIAEDLLVKGPQGFSGEWHSMNIRELIKEVISEKQQNPQNKQFELNCSLDQMSTQARRADLSRIISNLIQNSLEASDGQRENLITIDVSKRGLWIEIGIKDTGKGIAGSVLQKLRTDPASYDKPGGHGLGLKYSQTIVKKLGGRYEIHSKEGVGTEITLRLPTR